MTEAITKLAEKADPRIPTTIYYAFKQSEIEQEGLASTGWATFIYAIQKAGFAVVATWPVRTETPGRMVSFCPNALSNSVVLFCSLRFVSADFVCLLVFFLSFILLFPPP